MTGGGRKITWWATSWLLGAVVAGAALALSATALGQAADDADVVLPQANWQCDERFGCTSLALIGSRSSDVFRILASTESAWTFRSPDHIEAIEPECRQTTSSAVECRRRNGMEVEISGWGGDDRIRANTELTVYVTSGDAGDDRLIGSRGRDVALIGGDGDDYLRGRGGRDEFFGKDGSDEIRAGDGTRDHRINCGGGVDVAFVDEIDPPTEFCETVVERTE